jgi:glycosyl transferase, family 25
MLLHVFLINLDRDPDRLVHMRTALGQVGLVPERVPAVYGLAMPDWVKPYFLDADGCVASRLKVGEVGCYASHLVTAKRLLERGLPYALVCEDDLRFDADLVALIEATLAVLPRNWGIVRLSNAPKSPYLARADLPGERDLAVYSRVPNNTGAFLLSADGAKKLLKPGLRTLQIDEHLRRPWLLGMETFGIVPPPIVSNIFDSTIDDMDERGLGKETVWHKLKRRRWSSPSEWFVKLKWQVKHLTVLGYTKCLSRKLLFSDKKLY